jgi:hypothetical protein
MSSSGPGSVLVFLSFVFASALLLTIYGMMYIGLLAASGGVARQAEAAAEQAVIYIFGYPVNASTVGDRLRIHNETRIVIQNVGRGELQYDRLLAIGHGGEVVAESALRGRGLGSGQWLLYRASELGLPARYDNYTVFKSEVKRLVLLSARGRTHGSMWGVPTFMESLIEARLTRTVTSIRTYSYATPTTYTTTYTVTIPLPQSRYSVMGEVWVSDDGRTWGRVGKGWDLYSGPVWGCGVPSLCDWAWCSTSCGMGCEYGRRWLENGCFDGCLKAVGPPKLNGTGIIEVEKGPWIAYMIIYAGFGRSVTASAGNSFWQYGESKSCYYDYDLDQYVWRITQWGKRFVPQAIELVDWDTGEALGSTNSTSLSFQVGRNTIVRFKYVKAESWSRTWIIVPPPPPPPQPSQCDEILNDPTKEGSPEWCACARLVGDPRYATRCPIYRSCLTGSVRPCCPGTDSATGCLNSWSGGAGPPDCKDFTREQYESGVTKNVQISWSASWSLKPGWRYDDWGWLTIPKEEGNYVTRCDINVSGSSAGGRCYSKVPPSRHVEIVIIFKQTS